MLEYYNPHINYIAPIIAHLDTDVSYNRITIGTTNAGISECLSCKLRSVNVLEGIVEEERLLLV